jgi:hypothetical protein
VTHPVNYNDSSDPRSRIAGTDDHFGLCPRCADEGRWEEGVCLNVHKTHWVTCHQHKLRWCIGENLFSSWQHENPETWERNAALLTNYDEVDCAHLATWPDGVVNYPDLLEQRVWLREQLGNLADPGFPAEDIPF